MKIRVLTCNIRYYGGDDGPNHWIHRSTLCIDIIKKYDPDLICFQEVWREQLDDLLSGFRDFKWTGMVDEPGGVNPVNAIFYRATRFSRLSSGGWWLSESPHVPGSVSWGSRNIRLVNWVLLRDDATGGCFRLLNTHLDAGSQTAREGQARYLVEDSAAWPDPFPQVLTGDMNANASNEAIAIIKNGGWQDTYSSVHDIDNPGHTIHHFDGLEHSEGKIDWVFARGAIEVLDAFIVDDCKDGRYPSDHFFVGADIEITA